MTSASLPPGLIVVHGNHPEGLRDLLVVWMKRYPLAPLEKEIILVQSNGIGQWLKLALAADAESGDGGGCGIAAAVDFLLPSRFMWQAYRAVLGSGAVPETSPFDESRLLWRLMRLLPEVVDQPVFAPLRRFLDEDSDRRKRFQLAERLADLFDQYQVYRADWLAAWESGEDMLMEARGGRVSLPEEQRWQPTLWRALLEDVRRVRGDTEGAAAAGRAAVHESFQRYAGHWSEGERPIGLPRRVMVFGISSLPRQSLEVLATLAQWTQVLMCVHNPCEHYWADIIADRDLLRAEQARQRRRQGAPLNVAEEHLHLHAHPLLAAWGKQGRDFIGLLDEHDSEAARASYVPQFATIQQRIDLFASHGDCTLLQQLQDDIRDLRPLRETRERWPAVDPRKDRSIRFHIAHSPQREVEILHDQLLAAFDADSSLRPRDVIVMVPDIDAYAPHIRAVFGLLDPEDVRFIPFSLADQGRREADPLIGAVEKLLGLPQSRFAVSDILDLLEVPALRQRFGIDEEHLPRLHGWIRGANIRWGLHAEQRASLGLPAQVEVAAQHTWLFGVRRMLLGYAVGADAEAWRGIEPYGEVGGLDAALLGPLAQLLEGLEAAWRTLREPAPVATWCERLRSLLNDFFTTVDSTDGYTLLQLDSALQQWQEACADAALNEALPIAVVGDYWLSQLDEGGLSQRFFAGAVTFATLMPMRAIPFRHVCLLGMNDGDYPRQRMPLDFDLMGRDYRPGDRSRREDDRYLFLEALLSARQGLHVSWVGRSINDNSPRPPSVLVNQLRDHLAAGWRLASDGAGATKEAGEMLLAALTVEHRLQPFSPDYFPRRREDTVLFTYAREWRADYAGSAGGGLSAANLQLPPLLRREPLSVRELADFLREPVKAFFRQRLNVAFEIDEVTTEDQEPFELDGLGQWTLQDELIRAQAQALTRGEDIARVREARIARIRRRGDLAAGEFGEAMAEALLAPMDELFERYRAALARWPHVIEPDQEIRFSGEGQVPELADWLGDLRSDGKGQRGRVVLETSEILKDNHYRGERLIRHWIAHLATHVAGVPLTTVVVGKKGSVELNPLQRGEVEKQLGVLLSAWQEGMRRPLPLAARTAFAWLGAKGDAEAVARQQYEGAHKKLGEVQTCPYLRRAYPDFAALSSSGEFAQLATTLLRPLLEAIHVAKEEPAQSPVRQAVGDTK